MAGVMIYQRAERDFGLDLSARGHHVVYRANETNRCPGCGRGQWYVGRITAECGFCGTAVPLAEAKWSGSNGDKPYRAANASSSDVTEALNWAERRRHERIKSAGRTLQLLIDGAPHSFGLHNISAGGLMGDDPVGLTPNSTVQVRFEGGILVPAVVRWTEGPLTGLAFTSPVLLDVSASG
jgi:uncharacterized protein YbbK (DUF523 family)